MRSAAVILTQHRRSRRSAIHRFERALPRRTEQSRRNQRREEGNVCREAARAVSRTNSGKARAVRRRHRPDVLIPRGYLPLVVH
jgi:hypothetical protein